MSSILITTHFDPEPIGSRASHCPHCDSDSEMTVHRLRSTFGPIPVPSTEVLACTLCQALSRKEGSFSRIVGIAALAPMALVFAIAAATGLYILGSMLSTEFSPEYATIGIILIAAAGFFGRRTLAGIRRLWADRGLIPLEGLHTKL